jgi:phosphoglycolate phosphatase-like HAD superfamily hydrolase
MNLVMLDIDGTLTQSYEYDREIFGLAIAEVIGCQPIDADLNNYKDKTSLGVTQEAILRATGRNSTQNEIQEVKHRVLLRLEKKFHESPNIFCEVPGAVLFLEKLRKLDGVAIAIATGCWFNEALFKLKASGLTVEGIPMATSDDDRNRKMILKIAVEKALDFNSCSKFRKIIYLGDGPWDLQVSRSLGYAFIGIGSRVHELQETEGICWFQNFLKLETVFATILTLLEM